MATRGRKPGTPKPEIEILKRKKTMLEDSIFKLNRKHIENIMSRQEEIKKTSERIEQLIREGN